MPESAPKDPGKKWVWILLALLAGTIYLFWILPLQAPATKVDVQFESPASSPQKAPLSGPSSK